MTALVFTYLTRISDFIRDLSAAQFRVACFSLGGSAFLERVGVR